MNHLGTITIETPRLLLRRFVKEDAAAAFQNWTSDEKVTEFLTWPAHESQAVTESILQDWIDSYRRPDFYQWAIVLKEEGDEPIGTISVIGVREALNLLQIGYCIGSRWWNRGITSEAFSGILPYLFQEVGANRVESWHDPENPGSGRVMAKCGLRREGVLRQADLSNRGIVDAVVYSMLAEEFQAARLPFQSRKVCSGDGKE